MSDSLDSHAISHRLPSRRSLDSVCSFADLSALSSNNVESMHEKGRKSDTLLRLFSSLFLFLV